MSANRFFEEMIPAIITEIDNIIYNGEIDGSVNWDDKILHKWIEMLPSKTIDIMKSEGMDASYTIDEDENVIFHIDDKKISMSVSGCDEIWFHFRLE